MAAVPNRSHLWTWCDLPGLGLPDGLDNAALARLDESFGDPAAVRKREVLYRATAPFTALHAIRTGSFKTVMLLEDGREQIIGFHMPGEILGLEGIGNERYACEAVALEESDVCSLPFDKLDELARREPVLRRNLYRLMSRNLRRGRDMMVLLGSMSAEQRLAVFLLDVAHRLRHAGHSPSEFTLRMTRDEIASFLGIKLETVSRVFSRLHAEGVIHVQGRALEILDFGALRRVSGRALSAG